MEEPFIGDATDKLTVARRELIELLALLPEGTRFNVVAFGDGVERLSPRWLRLTPAAREAARQFLEHLDAQGATGAAKALEAAYQLEPKRVVFVSDCAANVGGSVERVSARAKKAIAKGVRIDTIALERGSDSDLMAQVALQSGGEARYP